MGIERMDESINEIVRMRDRMRVLEKKLAQREREISLLKEMSLFFSNSLQSTIDLFAYRMGILTNAKFARVYFIDKTQTKLKLVAGFNLSDKYLEMVKDKLEVSIESVPCGKAVTEKVPYVVNDVRRDDVFYAWRDIAAMHGYLSYVALPLVVSGRMLGAVDIFFEDVRYFSEEELNLMSVLANAGALAAENALLLERIAHISTVDEDTGAYNYKHFMETLRLEAARGSRYGQPLTLIMMRLLEEAAGETSSTPEMDAEKTGKLRAFVNDVKNKIRGSDILFRYRDDTFCLILTQTPRRFSADIVIARLRHSVNKTMGEGWTLATGVAGMPEDGSDAETLLRKASV